MHNEVEPTFQLPTLRQVVLPLFRHRTAVVVTFAVVAAAVALVIALMPRMYEAEMKLLVNRERADTIMTANAQSQGAVPAEISEGELYGEVELIQSRDVLERVVAAIGIDRLLPSDGHASGSEAERMAAAVAALRDDLTVDAIRKTTMIHVTYASQDPQLAARVLKQLSTVYLEKHLTVRRPAGAYDFFTEQAKRYTEELDTAQQALAAFNTRERVVAATTEKEIMLRKQNEFESDLDRTQATIEDLTRRLAEIEQQIRTTPDRQTTQVRDVGNIEMLRGLKNEILQLEITRSDMLTKFTPDYPPLQRVEEKLAQLKEAQERAEQTPLRDETTDQNPTSQWLRNEAARVRTERAALNAKAAALRRTVADYTARTARLDRQSVEEQELQRTVKVAEENQTLYRRKQEEARVSDALDRTRIANVAIAESPAVPQTPSGSRRGLLFVAGMLLAVVLSVCMAHLLDLLAPAFHTGDDVTRLLDIPVLATTPSND
jgi:uncharacterized protein involved in exopolysaccharide biosynthesis